MIEELSYKLRVLSELVEDFDKDTLESLSEKLTFILEDYILKDGYVYVIHIENDLYKIGVSNKDPYKKLEKVIKTNNIIKVQKQLHNKFFHSRLTQEIFRLNNENILYLQQLPGEWMDRNITFGDHSYWSKVLNVIDKL